MLFLCYNKFMALNTYDIALANGAEVYPLIYENADLASTFTYSSQDWGNYVNGGVLIDDSIHPDFDVDNISLPGSWTVSVPLGHLDDPASAHVRWDGGDVTVEYTLDGTSWTALSNGGFIDLGVDLDLDIRASFAGGVEEDPAQLTRLAVYVLQTDTLYSSMARRNIQFNDMTLSESVTYQLALGADDGSLLNGGYIDIMPDTSDTITNVKTIEFWAKKNNSATSNWLQTAAGTVSIANTTLSYGAPFTVWVDGVLRASGYNLTLNDWHHYRIQLATDSNDKIRIGLSLSGASPANMNIFGLATYPDVQVGNYEAALATPTVTVIETSSINVSESSPEYEIYAYAWSDS